MLRNLVIALAVCVVGCAPHRTALPIRASESEVFFFADLDPVKVDGMTAYDLVDKVRPDLHLSARGTAGMPNTSAPGLMVRYEGKTGGSLDALKRLPASEVEKLEFVPPREVLARFGYCCSTPLVLVTLR
jgi:hypothetical protein